MSGGVRELLAAALHHEGWPVEPDWKPEPETCGTCATTLRLADALLPVVERVVAEARAEALREVEALANEWDTAIEPDGSTSIAPVLWMAAELHAKIRAALGRQAGGGE